MNRTLLHVAVFTAFTGALEAQTVFSDSFSYPDGPLVGAPGSPWVTHSGTTGQANVASGRLFLSQTRSEDISAPLEGGPFSPNGGGSLYASFNLSLSSLPSGSGTYFAHFKDTALNFRGRLFVSVTEAVPGTYRLGIGNSTGATPVSGQLATDLTLNTSYTIVTRYDVATGIGTLWVDPTSEASLSVTATDPPNPTGIAAFSFRQSLSSGSGMGGMFVDNIAVTASFPTVVPEPSMEVLLALGGLALLVRKLGR